jgi:type VI secretion system protein ImpE
MNKPRARFDQDQDQTLAQRLAAAQAAVRAKPAAPHLRVYLFQLLALVGDWKRALAQLQVSAQLDPLAIPMAQTYREAVRCEAFRAEVFKGSRHPQILGEPPAWLALLLDALRLLAAGNPEAAEQARSQAFDLAPATAGTVNGQAIEWIADADSRLGPVCEAIINGQYYWLPFAQIKEIKFDPPEDLRDFVWIGAQITLVNGGAMVGLVPTRYPGSEAADRDEIRLARLTEWQDAGGECWLGTGQRIWATDLQDFALLDVRDLKLQSEAA